MKLMDILLEVMDGQEIDRFTDEAMRFIPDLKLKPNTFNKFGYPFYIIGELEYELGNVRKLLKRTKVELILKQLIDGGYVRDLKHSKTTDSKYFTVNGHKVRLSDHENPQNEFNGINLPIKWSTSIPDAVDYILKNTK
jgi:hypothetical protein